MNLDEMKALSGEEQEILFKMLDLTRHSYKTTNYACQYKAGAATVARAAGVTGKEGEALHQAYWAKNWSIEAIADSCIVKECIGLKWLWNPVAGLWYQLKAEKDRFSTLCQGTGAYCFDTWLEEILSRRNQITGSFHDEAIFELKKGSRDKMTEVLKDSIGSVNKRLNLNRDLDCDVAFGSSYSEIH